MRPSKIRASSKIASRPTNSGGGAPAPGENGFIIGSMLVLDQFNEMLYKVIHTYIGILQKCTIVYNSVVSFKGMDPIGGVFKMF